MLLIYSIIPISSPSPTSCSRQLGRDPYGLKHQQTVMPMVLSPHSETARKVSYRKGNLTGQWSPLASCNHCSSCPKPAERPLCEVKLLSEVSPSSSEHPHEADVRHRQRYRTQPTPADRQLNTHIEKLTLKKSLVRQNSQFCSGERQKQKG